MPVINHTKVDSIQWANASVICLDFEFESAVAIGSYVLTNYCCASPSSWTLYAGDSPCSRVGSCPNLLSAVEDEAWGQEQQTARTYWTKGSTTKYTHFRLLFTKIETDGPTYDAFSSNLIIAELNFGAVTQASIGDLAVKTYHSVKGSHTVSVHAKKGASAKPWFAVASGKEA